MRFDPMVLIIRTVGIRNDGVILIYYSMLLLLFLLRICRDPYDHAAAWKPILVILATNINNSVSQDGTAMIRSTIEFIRTQFLSASDTSL